MNITSTKSAQELSLLPKGLSYVHDRGPGIRRNRRGKGFSYVGPDGRTIKSAAMLKRIRTLVLPPAWRDVWICPSANGHIQATGRDARGRKQYRYHDRWRLARDETKFSKLVSFAYTLPRLRRRVDRDLALPSLSRTKVLATIVKLLEVSLIRIGNEEYARDNSSFGLTTLKSSHVKIRGAQVSFRFRGKSGVFHHIQVSHPKLAQVVKSCQQLPGRELFRYYDDYGVLRAIHSDDVNAYLHDLCGDAFTAKDFRTWAGTVLAAKELSLRFDCSSATKAKRAVVEAIGVVSSRLGNTKAVCRKSYVHPAVVSSYVEGTLQQHLIALATPIRGLTRDERAVLHFLERIA